MQPNCTHLPRETAVKTRSTGSGVQQLENTARLKAVKHDIARMYTVLRERELGISQAPEATALGLFSGGTTGVPVLNFGSTVMLRSSAMI